MVPMTGGVVINLTQNGGVTRGGFLNGPSFNNVYRLHLFSIIIRITGVRGQGCMYGTCRAVDIT